MIKMAIALAKKSHDVFTKAKRSEVMARIRSRGNKGTELVLAGWLRRHKLSGWRRHIEIRERRAGAVVLKVRPDFVFPRRRLAVFVDGCFWHGCPRHGTKPKGNRSFWRRKFAVNQARDGRVNRGLRRAGWRVLRLWEHELTKRNEGRAMGRVRRAWGKGDHPSP